MAMGDPIASPDPARRRTVLGLGAAAAALAAPAGAQARYPARPIEFVVAFGAGGTSDIYYRGLCNILSRLLGQSFVVVNKPGAGSAIGTAYIKRAAPDGHTLGNLTEVMMREQVLGSDQYDPRSDFTYIGAAATVPFGWAVRADSPIRTLAEMVEIGRRQPGKIAYGAAGSAKLPSWAMMLLEHRTGAKYLGVPYPSSAAIVVALLSEQIEVICDAPGALAAAVAGGRVRMLAVSSEQRLPQWPDVPTVRESGIDVVTTLPYGVGGPAKLPAEVVSTIEGALARAAADPEHAALVNRLNMAPWVRIGKEYDDYMRSQYAAMPDLMRSFGALPAR